MSETVAAARAKIRALTQDLELRNPVVGSTLLDQLLETETHRVATEVGMGETRTAAYVTLVANTHSYVIPSSGSLQYLGIVSFIYDYDRSPLTKTTEEWIIAQRRGTGTPSRGAPRYWAIVFGTDSKVTVYLYPEPGSVEAGQTLTAIFQQIPTNFADDAATIPFDESLLRGLEYRVAALAAASMSAESRTERGLDQLGPAYQAAGDFLVRAAASRLASAKLQDRVVVRRW